MITLYNSCCLICGKPATDKHHLIFGTANRKLADQDGLIIPLCVEHHTGTHSVHYQMELTILSQIIGQLAYEKSKCAEGMNEDDARQSFRIRYGKSYL